MNPVCIRIFDINTSKTISNHFLDVCLTGGEDGAKKIFEALENKFTKNDLHWSNCISLSVNNCSTAIWVRNSVVSRILNKNPNVYISGFPCHLAHIAASHANDAFSNLIRLNIENVCIDYFYWLDKSSKRKGKLMEYFQFCDQEYQSVLKHIYIRWLSLERCIGRILNKYSSLNSYFLSQHHRRQV